MTSEMKQVYHDVYDYVNKNGRSSLTEIIDAIDNDANIIYAACKHLKWDDYLDADTGNNEFWIDKDVAGLCPECKGELKFLTPMQRHCPTCDWEETWTCPRCGHESHDAITFPLEQEFDDEIEVDVTCQSLYITPTDGSDGVAFTHAEFRDVIEHFNSSPYTTTVSYK